MAIDSSHPPSPTSDFPAEKVKTKEARKNPTYKTKEIKFRKQTKKIILQNENGPCPLIAICNVLLLRDAKNPYLNRFQVSQDILMDLLGEKLFDSYGEEDSIENHRRKISVAIDLLPSFADGVNVNIKFRRINDFERTPELAIFDLLKIPLYHGWIVDPQDSETAVAIGCKSYNDLMTGLVYLETQAIKARGGQTRYLADSPPTSAEHGKLGRGDMEEERVLLRVLRLSEREILGIDTRRDSSSGKESVSGYSDVYLMSEDDSLVDSMDTASGSSSTPRSGNICHKSKCDDQVSSKESGDETVCVVEHKIDVREEVCSTTSGTKISGALDHDHLSSTEWGDEMVCDVEAVNRSKMTDMHITFEKANLESTKNDSKTTALHVTSSDTISEKKSNLESIIIDSSSEISVKFEAVTLINPDLGGRSWDNDQFSSKESKDVTDCDAGNKMNIVEEARSTTSVTMSGALERDQSYSMELGDKTVCDVETENSRKLTDVHVTLEKTNLESTKNDSSSEIQFNPEAVTFVNPDLTGRSQDDNVAALFEAEKCVSPGSPVYNGESLLGQISSEGHDTNGLTPREGEVIKNFLNNNASQLTFPGLFFLKQGLEEGELCVFFRNNHFHTMLKYENELYNLVTDQGYLNERDLVWEKLNEVNGDSVFITGDFKVFKSEESGNWDQLSALSNTADYIHSINSSSKEGGMEIDPDLKIAMELQKQELGEEIDFEVSMKKHCMSVFFTTRSESSPTMVQRWQMYNPCLLRSV